MKNDPPNIELLPTKALHPHPENRPDRSGMAEDEIADLAQSIVEQGICQPLVVRRVKKGATPYEIIIGERRWTAAQVAELKDVPCIVKDATDQQAHELRLIENLQRANISEVEEARELKRLLELKDDGGKALHTIESVSERIGKSVEHIYSRLKLLAMPPLALKAYQRKKLIPSIGLLLARIPDPKLAHKATLEVLTPYGNNSNEEEALNAEIEPMSFRKAKAHIENHYMIRVKPSECGFDPEDPNLVPVHYTAGGKVITGPEGAAVTGAVRTHGGACKACPFYTGNLRKQFADITSSDVCTHPTCFKMKKAAAFKRESKKVEAKGQVLLTPGKANAVLNHEGTGLASHVIHQYVDLRENFPGKRGKTYEDVIGEHLPEGSVQIAKGKKIIPLVSMDVALAAAKEAGVKMEKPAKPAHVYDPAAEQQNREQAAQRKALALPLAEQARKDVLAVAGKRKPVEAVLRFFFQHAEIPHELYQRRGWKNEDQARKAIGKMDLHQLAALSADILTNHAVNWQGDYTELFVTVTKQFAVKLPEPKLPKK
jgi:ParB/RepB/Spo0J family partition protein